MATATLTDDYLAGPALCRPIRVSPSQSLSIRSPGPLRLWLGGTAGPRQTPDRAGPSIVLDAGNSSFDLIDCGSGSALRLLQLGVELQQLRAIWFTHHHIDHHAELGYILINRWILSRGAASPLHLIGPAGTEALVHRLLMAHDYDIRTRVAHGLDQASLSPLVTEIDQGWQYDGGAVFIEPFRVDHGPVDQALGYRLRTRESTLVVSGDTSPCSNVAAWAEQADILIHEAILEGHGFPQFHTLASDAGMIASQANVSHLVLTHLIPADQPDEIWQREVRHHYDGPLTVGTDLKRVL